MDCMDFLQDMARRRVLLSLLEDMMYEPLYDELRTKQQLGYSVGCCLREAWQFQWIAPGLGSAGNNH